MNSISFLILIRLLKTLIKTLKMIDSFFVI